MGVKHKRMMSVEFEGFEEVIKRLEKLDGDIKSTTEKALKETHRLVTKEAEEAAQVSNLPAKGRYSSGDTLKSLKRDADILWTGTKAEVPVGFSISKGGLPSIFMMYGTPRYMKNQKMYNAIWGQAIHDKVLKAQEEIFYDEIKKLGG